MCSNVNTACVYEFAWKCEFTCWMRAQVCAFVHVQPVNVFMRSPHRCFRGMLLHFSLKLVIKEIGFSLQTLWFPIQLSTSWRIQKKTFIYSLVRLLIIRKIVASHGVCQLVPPSLDPNWGFSSMWLHSFDSSIELLQVKVKSPLKRPGDPPRTSVLILCL